MSEEYSNEPMLEMYIFETSQLTEQLEEIILNNEKSSSYTPSDINEIFRIMHTIKGSSAMMVFNNISILAHSIEDLFFFIREQKLQSVDCSTLSDLILEAIDFIKGELQKIMSGYEVDGDASLIIDKINEYLNNIKQLNPSLEQIEKPKSENKKQYYIPRNTEPYNGTAYKATIFFEEGCEMENIRAYAIIHNLKDIAEEIFYQPEDIIDNDDSAKIIIEQGFILYIKVDMSYDDMHKLLMQTIFLRELELIQLDSDEEFNKFNKKKELTQEDNSIKIPKIEEKPGKEHLSTTNQGIINVNVVKLDEVMDLVGELVIAEAIVTQNNDLKGLSLKNFNKAARQLHKITSELQDKIMSIRMVPVATTFNKMHRIQRDMSKKLGKEIELKLMGEETEVDKKIIEHISDPLMHLVRNCIDHGIENVAEREACGKSKVGVVTIEAKNEGSDVLIIVKDDGKGLNKEKILKKAKDNQLLYKPEAEMTEREIYNLIFLPGFSTNEVITEFSGRGVGMDVVVKNIESVGGSVMVDSEEGVGSTFTIKIPLTLAIIDGMNIRVGNSCYTIPIKAIKQSFRPKKTEIFTDSSNNEMIMVRGECYSILRLHELYKVKTKITKITEGILILVEHDDKTLCIFADELIGQQQVVIKALPKYIKNMRKIPGLAGCTLLGDGSISLIIDVVGLINL